MPARHFNLVAGLAWLMLSACAGPATLPTSNTTPIPTLVPVTESQGLTLATATPASGSLALPSHMPSAQVGQALYDANCAKCHGADGRGAVPGARDFTDVDFVRGESPATFFGTVSEGRGEMPPFKDKLSPDDRWNVVFYVWRFSTSSQTLATGKQVYDTNCAACHGPKGSGVVLGAADFTSMELMASGAPRDFYQIVTQGKGSMPSWQGRLSQDDRWAVIDFVRTFTYDPALAGEAATMSATEAAATNAVTEAACDATQSNPVKWDDAEALSAGKEIYQQNCSACHAADGKGALPGAPNFTDPAVQSQIKSTSGEFLCTITSGRGMMPGWKDKLTVDQMWQVLTYIASLAQ